MIKPLKNGFGDCLLHSRLLGLNQVIPNEVTRQHTQTHAHTHTCVCVCMYAIYIYIYIYRTIHYARMSTALFIWNNDNHIKKA